MAEVAHSDLAYAIVASPDTEPVAIILTPKAFRAESMPVPTGRASRAALDAFVEWSKAAPRQATADGLTAMIKTGNTFAEDLVWELLDQLQIRPLPDSDVPDSPHEAGIARVAARDLVGFLQPMSWMGEHRSAGRPIPWSAHRFVPGHGADFCGIWDRLSPAAPLLTYKNDLRGREALSMDLVDLDARLDLGDESDAFDGMIGLLGHLGGFFPGGREYDVLQSRFVPGWGAGFAAVWDREHGAKPVVSFKGKDEARYRAIDWARQAMMRILAADKVLGPDRWISTSREVPYDDGVWKSTLWLLAYEDADPAWPPHGTQGEEADGYVANLITKLRDGFDLDAMPIVSRPNAEYALHQAEGYGASNDWLRVPDEVPRTLLETARWATQDSPFASSLVPSPFRE